MAVNPNDMLSPTFLMGAIETRPDRNAIRQSYIGDTLFPRREVPERRLMWDSMVSENNLAGFYSPKGNAVPGSDLMFATHFADLVDIKASRYLDADILMNVRDAGFPAVVKNAGDSFAVRTIEQRVRQHISESLAWCEDAVDAQLEYMAVQAMTGSITWPPKDANGNTITDPMPHWNPQEELTVTFPLQASFVQDASTLTGYNSRVGGGAAWNDPNNNPDPILDLEVIAELMVEETGINPYGARIIMSRSTLSQIAFLPNVLRWLVGYTPVGGTGGSSALFAQGAPQYADVQSVKNFIQTRIGYDIVLYDAQWTYRTLNTTTGVEEVHRVKFLPEGKIIIIPKDANPGFMAVAPHEIPGRGFVSGKAPWYWESDKPPVIREMGVNVVAFPVLVYTNEIFVLDTYA